MRGEILWQSELPQRQDGSSPIYSMTFRPVKNLDGGQLLVSLGHKIFVFDSVTGHEVDCLNGHTSTIYTLDYSVSGTVFASGGADKTVIIWSAHRHTGKLKYTHNDSIQCVKFNPVSVSLLSCSSNDFGIWSSESDVVPKTKVSSKILCCSWTPDGQFFAIGHYNGSINIYSKSGEHRIKIERREPIWCLSFNPSIDEEYDVLAVGCWDQTLSFYNINGKQINGRDKYLHFDPCFVEYFNNGEYICVGGSDKKVTLWTKHGIKLTTAATRDKWLWCAKQRPDHNFVAAGTNEGQVSMHKLYFSTVHGLYQDQYAYRDFMTTVVVHHLVTEQKAVVNCREYVKKVSIFKNRLAVQLPDRIIIYDLSFDPIQGVKCKARNKIMKKFECTLLVVASYHFAICEEKKIQLYNFDGEKENEWILDDIIRYIKVSGGPSRQESLLVGLKNGIILKIFIQNSFPIQLASLDNSIRCLDLSRSRRGLAVVDDKDILHVYDLRTNKISYQDSSVKSVAWNTDYEEMFCYSGSNSMVYTKTADFPVDKQKMEGFVVGFKGSKVFNLNYLQVNTVDIPQTSSLYRFIERKEWKNAYNIACLGVTDDDWKILGIKALADLCFDYARRSFVRIHDIKYLELLDKLEKNRRKKSINKENVLAEIYAYQGKFRQAADIMIENGQVTEAINMYSDLRMWNEAKRIAAQSKSMNVRELILKQAQQAERSQDLLASAELFAAAGENDKAIDIMSQNGWTERLLEVCRGLNKMEIEAIKKCAMCFVNYEKFDYAKEAYKKIGDYQELLLLHVKLQEWENAFAVLELHPKLSSDVYLPYATWLASRDRFDEALKAFKKARAPEKAFKMVNQLYENAILETRFKEASHYSLQLATESLLIIQSSEWSEEETTNYENFEKYLLQSEIYYAYEEVYQFAEMPFSTRDSIHLCNIARFLLMNMDQANPPKGVSKFNIVYTLASLALKNHCYKLARTAFDMLENLKIPHNIIDKVHISQLRARAKPFTDDPDLIPLCYRCSAENPFLNLKLGDCCNSCLCPFVRSFYSFEQLPLVEFVLPEGMTDTEAKKLIHMEPPKRKYGSSQFWSNSDATVLTLDHGDDVEEEQSDPFNQLLLSLQSGEEYVPLTVTKEVLISMEREQVFIVDWETPGIPCQYYRNMVPDIPIAQCPRCQHFFHEQEYEYQYLIQGGCPFCKLSADSDTSPE
eukprot:gb/GECH01010506.1/.p1 GENE.gb/GECH01010506.1/~~gb/GECH01010506.1/.p1  ORF type:complete len:1200 (+),score=262.07 gb/GECH01010506.1/:1-3600(+)